MKRLLTLMVALATSLTFLLAGATPAQAHSGHHSPAPTVTYVALGDSYSAGVGAGSYDPAAGNCLRSARAYPNLLAGRFHRLDLTEFKACSGATTDDLIATQLPKTPDAGVESVTVTIGGNDVGTFLILGDCLGQDGVPGCSDQGKAQVGAAITQLLPVKLALALGAIHAAYPNATVYVGSYMELFGNRKAACKVGEMNSQPLLLTYADKTWLNTMAHQLNATIRQAVHTARATMPVRFVNVSRVFNGHGLCDSARPWIGSVNAATPEGAFHPTARGQWAYARMFHAAGVAR